MQFVRITQSGNAIASVIESEVSNWHHYKIVIDNTSTMKVYKDYSDTPTIIDIDQSINWSKNVSFRFWTTGSNTEIQFKNFQLYNFKNP